MLVILMILRPEGLLGDRELSGRRILERIRRRRPA